jgi:3-oxoacyl-[acyl-carrier protein] reductase
MPGAFDGKVVVVTGGSRGIGRAVAGAVADTGAPAPLTVAGDLRALKGCEALFAAVKERYGRCDVLINNAGATRGGKFLDLPDNTWTDGFALKYFSAVRLTRLFWPLLKEAHGNIIYIVGGAARTPGPDFLIGGSVNAAVANFAKGLAVLGNRDDINVNVIHPGQTETDRVVQLFEQFSKAQGKTPDEVRRDTLAKSGARRIGQPEDIAALALFLCGDVARHIQGAAITVDGGTQPGYY